MQISKLSMERSLGIIYMTGWRPSLILDVGVMMGTDGLYDVWPNAPLVLVDPVPSNLVYMEKIARERPNTRIFPVGASNRTGFIRARIAKHGQAVLGSRKNIEGWENTTVETMTVDKIIKACNVDGPYLLKIDTDTHEQEILSGSRRTMKSTDVLIIEGGFYNHMKGKFPVADLFRIMAKRGFALFDICRVGRNSNGMTRLADFVFVRQRSKLMQFLYNQSAVSPETTNERLAQRVAASQLSHAASG